jgi:hypothetical protein
LYRSPLSFSTLSLLFHISFIHPLALPSSFTISPRSFLSLSLSFHYIHSTWAQFSLSLFIAHSAPSFLSFHPIPVFSLLIPTSKSRHHFSFFCTLSPQVFQNFLCHTPLILPVVSGFFDSFPSSLLIWSLSLSHSSSFIHLPFALNLSTSSLAYPFLSLLLLRVFFFHSFQHSVSILHSSLPSILSPLKYFSCISSTSSCSFHPQITAPHYFSIDVERSIFKKVFVCHGVYDLISL